MKVTQIFIKDIKVFLSSIKFFILLLLVLPITIGFLYGLMYERSFNPDRQLQKAKVALVDLDGGQYSSSLKSVFTNDAMKDFIDLQEVEDIDTVKKNLEKGDYSTAIVIPLNFSKDLLDRKNTVIKILKAPSAGFESSTVYDAVYSYVNILNSNSSLIGTLEDSLKDKSSIGIAMEKLIPDSISLETSPYVNTTNLEDVKKLNSKQYFFTSMLIFMSLFICLITAQGFIKEREDGTLKRLEAASLDISTLFTAKILCVFVLALVEITMIIGISSLFGVKWAGNYMNLILVILLQSFTITGITAFFMGVFRQGKILGVVFSLVTTLMACFGATFYPLMYSGGIARTLAEFTINYWMQLAYSGAILGKGINEFITPIVILLVTGTAGLIIGRLKFGYK